MRNLVYVCKKGNIEEVTKSYNEMKNLVDNGYTAEVELEEVFEHFEPTEKRKAIIIQ